MDRLRATSLLATAILVFSACQGAGTTTPSTSASAAPVGSVAASPQPSSAEKVTLTFLTGFTGGDRPAYEGLITKFNETHPSIEVKMDIQPWDTIGQELPGAIATGKGPDLATPNYNPGSIFSYAKAGSILPVDDAYGAGPGQVDRAAMPASVFEGFTLDGKVWAVPANFATLMLYHNKKALAEAGLTAAPATMDELRDAAVKLTKKDASGNVTQYGIALADNQTIAMWPILIWAEGGDLVNDQGCSGLADPKTIAAVKSWADLIVNEGVSPVGLTGQEADNLFAAGKAAMEMNGPWATGQYTPAGIDYDVAPIPKGAGDQVTLAAIVPIVVNKNTKNKEAAYEFLAWWTGKEAQTELALGSGFPPARTDVADDPALQSNPWVPKFAAAAPYSKVYLAGVADFAEIDTDVFTPAIGRITRGESAEAVLTEAAQQMNQILGCS